MSEIPGFIRASLNFDDERFLGMMERITIALEERGAAPAECEMCKEKDEHIVSLIRQQDICHNEIQELRKKASDMLSKERMLELVDMFIKAKRKKYSCSPDKYYYHLKYAAETAAETLDTFKDYIEAISAADAKEPTNV